MIHDSHESIVNPIFLIEQELCLATAFHKVSGFFPHVPIGFAVGRKVVFDSCQEDIESLGFKKSNKNSWIGYKDYFLDSINPEYQYFLFATIHIPIRDDMYKILVHRYYNEDEPIDEDDNYREPTCVYVGKIKNKSELNQLLKRLNIINE